MTVEQLAWGVGMIVVGVAVAILSSPIARVAGHGTPFAGLERLGVVLFAILGAACAGLGLMILLGAVSTP